MSGPRRGHHDAGDLSVALVLAVDDGMPTAARPVAHAAARDTTHEVVRADAAVHVQRAPSADDALRPAQALEPERTAPATSAAPIPVLPPPTAAATPMPPAAVASANAMQLAQIAQQRARQRAQFSAALTEASSRLQAMLTASIDCVQGDDGFACSPEPPDASQPLLRELFLLLRDARTLGIASNPTTIAWDDDRRLTLSLR